MQLNTRFMSLTAIAAMIALLGVTAAMHAQNGASSRPLTVKTMPPSVVKTVPRCGDTEVDPALTEIKVTFSKDMKTDRMWAFCRATKETFPENAGTPHYLEDNRTCVMPVKLEPGKTYVIWCNQGQVNSFRDTANNPAVPYLLVFETKK